MSHAERKIYLFGNLGIQFCRIRHFVPRSSRSLDRTKTFGGRGRTQVWTCRHLLLFLQLLPAGFLAGFDRGKGFLGGFQQTIWRDDPAQVRVLAGTWQWFEARRSTVDSGQQVWCFDGTQRFGLFESWHLRWPLWVRAGKEFRQFLTFLFFLLLEGAFRFARTLTFWGRSWTRLVGILLERFPRTFGMSVLLFLAFERARVLTLAPITVWAESKLCLLLCKLRGKKSYCMY